jgi:hypothetical protein
MSKSITLQFTITPQIKERLEELMSKAQVPQLSDIVAESLTVWDCIFTTLREVPGSKLYVERPDGKVTQIDLSDSKKVTY